MNSTYEKQMKIRLIMAILVIVFLLCACENGQTEITVNQEEPVTKICTITDVDKHIYMEGEGGNDAIIGEWYYTNVYDYKTHDTNFIKMNINNSDIVVLRKKLTNFLVYQNAIYYLHNGIHKMSLEGIEEGIICDGDIDMFDIDDNGTFYFLEGMAIYSLHEGEQKKHIYLDNTQSFTLKDGRIYISGGGKHGENVIIDTESLKVELTWNEPKPFVKYDGIKYRCVEGSKYTRLYKENELLYKFKEYDVNTILAYHNCLYVHMDGKVFQYNLHTGESKRLSNKIEFTSIGKDTIYCLNEKHELLCLNLDGSLKQTVKLPFHSNKINKLIEVGDWLYGRSDAGVDFRLKKTDFTIEYYGNGGWIRDPEREGYDKYVNTLKSFNGINANKAVWVNDYKLEDVTGDNMPDELFLVDYGSHKKPVCAAAVVKNGATGEFTLCKINYKFSESIHDLYCRDIYGGKLDLADFDNDGVKDICMSFTVGDAGGSGGDLDRFFSVFSFNDGKCRWLIDGKHYVDYIFNEFGGMDNPVSISVIENDGVPKVVAKKGKKPKVIYKYNPVKKGFTKQSNEK